MKVKRTVDVFRVGSSTRSSKLMPCPSSSASLQSAPSVVILPILLFYLFVLLVSVEALVSPSSTAVPSSSSSSVVSIVTGANGYLGREIVYQFLQEQQQQQQAGQNQDHRIFCLVRSHRVNDEQKFWNEQQQQPNSESCQHLPTILPYDMLDGGTTLEHALKEACQSDDDDDDNNRMVDVCVYHVASVFGPTQDGIKTAHENVFGTVDVVQTLSKFMSKQQQQQQQQFRCRLVLTSSMAAVRGSGQTPLNGSYYTSEDWNTVSTLDKTNWGSCYQWSKTESERLAWGYARLHNIPMAAICPSFVFGRPTGSLNEQSNNDTSNSSSSSSSSFSITLVKQWVMGESPVQSRLCVDIRDVAKAHIVAAQKLKNEEEKEHDDSNDDYDREQQRRRRNRYIVSSERRLPSQELADELRNVCVFTGLGDPTAITHDSTFVGGAIPIGEREVDSITKLRDELGMELRPVTETIRDMGKALLLMEQNNRSDSSSSAPSPTVDANDTTERPSRHILYDIPVSNNGARCRIILYKKCIDESECTIKSPMNLGGFKSEEYLQISPEGKVPSLQICSNEDHNAATAGPGQVSTLAESDTVARYLLKTYESMGPSFQPDSPPSNEIARFHDMYLTTIQGCLYKATPPFGPYSNRKEALEEYSRQLYVIADQLLAGRSITNDSPYLCGTDVSLADATLFPSIVFAAHMFPKFDTAWNTDNPSRPAIPPKIEQWFHRLIEIDDSFKRVYTEMKDALGKWDERGRWDTIWLAGIRDEEPATIFDKIIAGEIPATIVKEDDHILAFRDINPAAPQHVLVIPKDRQGLTRITQATSEHYDILGRLMVAAGEIAKDESLGFEKTAGARIVINDGKDGGQEVSHLHVHVLGGRPMTWPPG